MKPKINSSKNKLCLNLFEANLQRHPSVKNLYDEDGNKKSSSKSNDEFLLLSIKNQYEKNDIDLINNEINQGAEEKSDDINKRINIQVEINRVEEKLVDNKETYFTEMNEEDKNQIIKNNQINSKNLNVSKPLSYKFDEKQKKFDDNITEAISKGKDYTIIENQFEEQLKKK